MKSRYIFYISVFLCAFGYGLFSFNLFNTLIQAAEKPAPHCTIDAVGYSFISNGKFQKQIYCATHDVWTDVPDSIVFK